MEALVVLDEATRQMLITDYEADHEDYVAHGGLTGRSEEQVLGGERVWQRVFSLLGLNDEIRYLQTKIYYRERFK